MATSATTETWVANLALQRIGVATTTSLTGTDKASVAAALIFADTRDEVQRMFPWKNLTARTALSTNSAGTSAYSYVHTLGLDCLRVLEIIDIADDEAQNPDYRIEYRSLYHNLTQGYVRYIKQTTNITPWDPLMLTAIECRLASKLAIWLTGQVALQQALQQEIIQVLGVAVQTEAMEGRYDDNIKTLAMISQQFIPTLAEQKRVNE